MLIVGAHQAQRTFGESKQKSFLRIINPAADQYFCNYLGAQTLKRWASKRGGLKERPA